MTQLNDDTEEQQEDVAESALPTSGELLKAAREAAGLSVLQVADRLRLRQQLIHELEADKLDGQASGTYVRGYLRAYAKLVQIPEAEIMDAYKRTRGSEEPESSTMQSFSRKTSIETQDSRLMMITWIIVLLLIASVAVFVWQQFVDDKNGNSQSVTTPAQTQQSASTVTANPDAESYNSADSEWGQDVGGSDLRGDIDSGVASAVEAGAVSEETAAINQAAVPTGERSTATSNAEQLQQAGQQQTGQQTVQQTVQQSAEQAVAEQTAAPREPAAREQQSQPTSLQQSQQQSQQTSDNADSLDAVISNNELVLVFRGDSWVNIQDADGESIAFGVKVTDHVMPLNSAAPYQLTLGAPSVVDVYFRGQKIDLSQYSGGRVARFQLPAE